MAVDGSLGGRARERAGFLDILPRLMPEMVIVGGLGYSGSVSQIECEIGALKLTFFKGGMASLRFVVLVDLLAEPPP